MASRFAVRSDDVVSVFLLQENENALLDKALRIARKPEGKYLSLTPKRSLKVRLSLTRSRPLRRSPESHPKRAGQHASHTYRQPKYSIGPPWPAQWHSSAVKYRDPGISIRLKE